ncbi:Fe(2+) transporter permease subunit FeoB [Novispirillum itersonii]|uniref:Ferrous iron transport protein B n=1 Tax=Novispirillum itersonii TaxID=189 RepID=A0A7W9ZGS0_NOVIT|nr:Fe(2+) transporter permease subunit FeoB [Novispirillum itersonii]MBB6211206.1 ferrous iron transport protein B [Novispirillum itersonii]
MTAASIMNCKVALAGKVVLAGNPNCGKTTLFNALTGSRQQVGNWPGVTVEQKRGTYPWQGSTVEVVDLPGLYMISGDHGPQDERVSRDYLTSGETGVVINVIDASTLERSLYLTVQMMERRVPLVVAVNMMDLAEKAGVEIDLAALSAALGCPVVPLVASRRRGLDALKKACAGGVSAPAPVPYPEAVERAIAALRPALGGQTRHDPRWLAVRLLEATPDSDFAAAVFTATPGLREQVEAVRQTLEREGGEDADILIADARYQLIGRITATACRRLHEISPALTRRLDAIALNRFLGVPLFLGIMYLMFVLTISVGGAFIDLFDQGVGALLVDWPEQLLTAAGAPGWLMVTVTGLGSGIQTVATFAPVIGSLFLVLSALEDSGYMARAAFVMDRAMRGIGLPGKAFVPLIVGFGCNVPAVMAARTLDSHRDRVMTAMMAPFMACGARLPVFALFAAAFFPSGGQNVVFGLYLLGIAVAVITGLILKTTLLRGEAAPFVMELPPYHIPTLHGIVWHAWQRLRDFLLRAGQVIVPMVLALSLLSSFTPAGEFRKDAGRESILAAVSSAVSPVLAPMGLREDNWPATVGLVTGIFAKEAVIGTLNSLYGSADTAEEGTPFVLADALQKAVATVPANLAALGQAVLDPLKLGTLSQDSTETTAALGVNASAFGAMTAYFDGGAGALAYMVLILLYTPCVATLGAIRQEAGGRWAAFAAGWTTSVAYVMAVMIYQGATWLNHPGPSALWIAGGCAILLLGVTLLRQISNRGLRAAS